MRLQAGCGGLFRLAEERLLHAPELLTDVLRRQTTGVVDQRFVNVDLVYEILAKTCERAEKPFTGRPHQGADDDRFDLDHDEFVDLGSSEDRLLLECGRKFEVVGKLRDLTQGLLVDPVSLE